MIAGLMRCQSEQMQGVGMPGLALQYGAIGPRSGGQFAGLMFRHRLLQGDIG